MTCDFFFLKGALFSLAWINKGRWAFFTAVVLAFLWVVWLCGQQWALSASHGLSRASLGAQRVKRLAAMQETGVRSLGREDPLEKEMATHSSTLAWKIPDQEEPGGLQSMGLQGLGHDWGTSLSFSFTFYTSRASSSHLILFSGTQWEESCLSELWAQGMWLQIL